MNIVEGDLESQQVLVLLRTHLAGMHENSPPGSVYALDLSALKAPEVSFYTAWHEKILLGMGALKEIASDAGEIKSMRTNAAYVRKGVAAALLDHMLGIARQRGYRRVSLETGSGPAFEPALSLYRKYGFVNGDVFSDYKQTGFSQFLHFYF
ncbi:MAG TPA: GNAT family N-acetyltransferase [Hyphomicrobiales bacterium]|nr:GNAT family N-acetyltransferase [Hyphomicrobiales bacterium]